MSRILIAEDELRIAGFLEKGLRANGYATLTVTSGTEAAAMARDADFDLMILDLGLARHRRVQRVIRDVCGTGPAASPSSS